MCACSCVCVCVCKHVGDTVCVDIMAGGGKKKKWISFLPNLVKATGVETLLRFPSSARFDELPVQGKSFPLRNTMNCSLQVELSTDCSAAAAAEEEEEDEIGGPVPAASGKWIEATATEFCRMMEQEEEKKRRKIK